jgi:hypothetical protein
VECAVTLQELRASNRDQILRLASKRGARNLRVFGSVARGDDDAQSDIDFLVDLERLLGGKVDVVSSRGLRERVRERVLRDAVPL